MYKPYKQTLIYILKRPIVQVHLHGYTFMKKTSILVTGAAGFIGFHLTNFLLKKGFSVVGVDNLSPYYSVDLKRDRLKQLEGHSNFIFYEADISNKKMMKSLWNKYEFKKIVNLAAQAGVRYSLINPFEYIKTNVTGLLVLLELARFQENFENFVYASSSSVYGKNNKHPFSVEDRVDTPISVYAATKRMDELLAHTYTHLYNFPTTGLRFFTVYGPWGRPDQAAFLFADKMRKKEPIHIFNNGEMQRDFTYIDDIITGIYASLMRENLKKNPYRLYNLGNSHTVELMKYVELLEDSLGIKAQKKFMPMQMGDVKATCADIAQSQKELGYNPKTPVEEGLKNFIDWYKTYYKI